MPNLDGCSTLLALAHQHSLLKPGGTAGRAELASAACCVKALAPSQAGAVAGSIAVQVQAVTVADRTVGQVSFVVVAVAGRTAGQMQAVAVAVAGRIAGLVQAAEAPSWCTAEVYPLLQLCWHRTPLLRSCLHLLLAHHGLLSAGKPTNSWQQPVNSQ